MDTLYQDHYLSSIEGREEYTPPEKQPYFPPPSRTRRAKSASGQLFPSKKQLLGQNDEQTTEKPPPPYELYELLGLDDCKIAMLENDEELETNEDTEHGKAGFESSVNEKIVLVVNEPPKVNVSEALVQQEYFDEKIPVEAEEAPESKPPVPLVQQIAGLNLQHQLQYLPPPPPLPYSQHQLPNLVDDDDHAAPYVPHQQSRRRLSVQAAPLAPQDPLYPQSIPEQPKRPSLPTRPVSWNSAPFQSYPALGIHGQTPHGSPGAASMQQGLVPAATPAVATGPLNYTQSNLAFSTPLMQSQSAPVPLKPAGPSDDIQTSSAKRFVGNMLVTRVGRSSFQSAASTVKLPLYLSPWGDNNPVTLPNIRKRDIAFMGLATFGMDQLAPSAVDIVDKVVEKAIVFTAEGVMDETTHKLSSGKPSSVVKRANAITLELRISHKMMGHDARIQLWGEREAVNRTSCAKGWFCPYLYASGRTPSLVRAKDFAAAEFLGPGLKADSAVAQILLNSLAEVGAPITALCPIQPLVEGPGYFHRVAVFLVGISPYRTANSWSQARIGNEARLRFHLFTHTPTLVLPALSSRMPLCAWSPWTLSQMMWSTQGWLLEHHLAELMGYLEAVVDMNLMIPDSVGSWRETAAHTLRQTLSAAQQLGSMGNAMNFMDKDRAGIVWMKF